jgi:hypothetical protein
MISQVYANENSCASRNAKLQRLVCLNKIVSANDWHRIAKPSSVKTVQRISKWMMPANQDARLSQGFFVNTNVFKLHWKMLKGVYPDLFPGITALKYSLLVIQDRPEFNSGEIKERLYKGKTIYTFSVWGNPSLKKTDISFEEVLDNYQAISEIFPLRPLLFEPSNRSQRLLSKRWGSKDFSVFRNSKIEYEVYSQQQSYGYLKLLSTDGLEEAQKDFSIGYQDLLVLDEAPIELNQPIAGSVTASRQADLSHLNILNIARGTPNCFIKNAHKALAGWQGKLVLFSCNEFDWNIEIASLEDAQSWWARRQSNSVDIIETNRKITELSSLLELPIKTTKQRELAVSVYGSKGANLAGLYQNIDPQYQLKGFLIPAYYYQQFMTEQGWQKDLGTGEKWVSFAETIDTWLGDDEFQSSSAIRHKRLKKLRKAMRRAGVSSDLLKALSINIREVWGNDNTMVRFRSSSNAEDALGFSGAGLYDSTSACLADEIDQSETGSSKCDQDKNKRRTLSRALKKVWASLWSSRAFEEREWYGVNHRVVSMSILVNTRSKDERANMVVFSGDPDSKDNRVLINSQLGHLSVVSDDGGVFPERIIIDNNGDQYKVVDRQSSSEKKTPIISNKIAVDIAELMANIELTYPSSKPTEGSKLLLDTEWKILKDGRLIIKQIRPFIREP